MGRRRKKSDVADNIKVFFIGVILTALVACGVYYGLKFFSPGGDILDIPERKPPVTVPPEDPQKPEDKPVEPPKTQEYVNVFFIGKNENNEEVYRAVKRIYSQDVDGSKIKFAMTSLFLGPKPAEKEKGVYTEVPAGTHLLGIIEKPDRVIINVSPAFSTGGGTESVYKRLFQIIKTAKKNTEKPVYLFINGQQADVIGGDGIMITQPLSERSLE